MQIAPGPLVGKRCAYETSGAAVNAASTTPPTYDTLATVSHELRNPLTLIRSEIALLRRIGADPAAVAEACDIIDRQVTHMTGFLRDVIALARNDGVVPLAASQPIAVRDLLTRSVGELGALIDPRLVRVTLHSVSDALVILGDDARLTQALTAILMNAARFAGMRGDVSVTAREHDRWAEIVVRDNTGGIPAEMLATVFEPFVRGRRDGVADAGISLAISRQCIEAHGGTVRVESGGVGGGTDFIVRLPRLAA